MLVVSPKWWDTDMCHKHKDRHEGGPIALILKEKIQMTKYGGMKFVPDRKLLSLTCCLLWVQTGHWATFSCHFSPLLLSPLLFSESVFQQDVTQHTQDDCRWFKEIQSNHCSKVIIGAVRRFSSFDTLLWGMNRPCETAYLTQWHEVNLLRWFVGTGFGLSLITSTQAVILPEFSKMVEFAGSADLITFFFVYHFSDAFSKKKQMDRLGEIVHRVWKFTERSETYLQLKCIFLRLSDVSKATFAETVSFDAKKSTGWSSCVRAHISTCWRV